MHLDIQIDIINSTLKDFQNIFNTDVTHNLKPDKGFFKSDIDGEFYRTVRWPKGYSRDNPTGLILKNDMGLVALEHTFRKVNERVVESVGYSYKFMNLNHSYLFLYDDGETQNDRSENLYSFRYDENLRPTGSAEPQRHIQVLNHTIPRFISADATLINFLRVVRDSCYEKTGARMRPFFSNR
jgi:hypothetical protein